MPFSARKLSDLHRSTKIQFNANEETVEINFTYKLSSMGIDLDDWLAEHAEDREYNMGWLERLLTTWDLTDDDGKPLPTTAAAMEEYGIPTPVIRMMLNACYEDGNATSLKNSFAAGSSAQASRKNGTS